MNHSTQVTEDETKTMCEANDSQLRLHYGPTRDRVNLSVVYVKPNTAPPPDADVVGELVDDISEAPGALAYHYKDGDQAKMRIGVGVILANGGVVNWDTTNPTAVSVSSALSHEILEAAEDPDCNDWCDDASGTSTAKEIADPVEADTYPVTNSDGTIAGVSNFVLNKWFDPACPSAEYTDYLGHIQGPGTLAPGGYKVVRSQPQDEQQVEARKARAVEGPERIAWLREAKEKGNGRGKHRKHAAHAHA